MRCTAAAEAIFKLSENSKFSNNGFSYFALHNNDWLIIGLDTAYWGHYQSLLYEDGYLSDPDPHRQPRGTAQLTWLTELLNDPRHAGKRLMLLTHHDGFDVDVGKVSEKKLYGQIIGLLGNNRDCLWYWGHVHAGIAYKPIRVPGNTTIRARCVGHGGVPYPPFGALDRLGSGDFRVEWAEQENAITGDRRRAWNGFMRLTLKGRNIREEFYDEHNRLRWANSC
jgi:hypothetical protein